jgi:hypothetical protein
MRTFHKYSLSCTGRGSSRGSRGSSHNLMSKSNSTTVTRERCELCGSSLCNLIDVHFERKYNQSKRFYYARDIDDLLSSTVAGLRRPPYAHDRSHQGSSAARAPRRVPQEVPAHLRVPPASRDLLRVLQVLQGPAQVPHVGGGIRHPQTLRSTPHTRV